VHYSSRENIALNLPKKRHAQSKTLFFQTALHIRRQTSSSCSWR